MFEAVHKLIFIILYNVIVTLIMLNVTLNIYYLFAYDTENVHDPSTI